MFVSLLLSLNCYQVSNCKRLCVWWGVNRSEITIQAGVGMNGVKLVLTLSFPEIRHLCFVTKKTHLK